GLERPVRALRDRRERPRDPALEVGTRDRTLEPERRIREGERRRVLPRQALLHAIHRAVQGEAEVVVDQVEQRADLLRLDGVVQEAAKELEGARRLQHGERVPLLEVREDPERDLEALARFVARAAAERGRDGAPDELRVEDVAGDADAVTRQHAACTIAVAPCAGPDAQDREVARPAAEVRDEDELVVVEPTFVVMGRRDRLEHEGHVVEPRAGEPRAEPCLRYVVVARAARPGELNRPPPDRPPPRIPPLGPRRPAPALEAAADSLLP